MSAMLDVSIGEGSNLETADTIRELNQRYLALQRHDGDADAILQWKLAATHRRANTLRRLLAPAASGAPVVGEALADALTELRIYLDERQQARLAELLPERDLFARVMAGQGIRVADAPRYHRAAGPGIDLNIPVSRSSVWPFSRWKENTAFSEYEYQGEGVLYRGVLFCPGDVILANTNSDGNMIYSALSDPKSCCTHSAVVALLTDGERRYPAVLETYEKGLRAVPLCVFLNPRYLAYAEVYRHRELTPAQYVAFNDAAQSALTEVAGYNFYSVDDDPHYISCTAVAQRLLQAAGLARVRSRSAIANKGIQRNLRALDHEQHEPFFAPGDYLLNPDFACVGWIDNNQLDRLVTRELITAQLRALFADTQLTCKRLPLMYHVNLWGIGHIRRRTLIGWFISRVTGFDHVSLPKGPDRMLAAAQPIEAQLSRAVRRTLPFVRDYLAMADHIDLHTMLKESPVQAVLEENLRLPWLRRYFINSRGTASKASANKTSPSRFRQRRGNPA